MNVLPADIRLGPVTLQVSNLERSLGFYEVVLGLVVLTRKSGYAELGALDGAPLIKLREYPGARPVPRRGRLGLYHIAFLLPERAALGAFLRQVSAAHIRVGMADHLFSEALYLNDPDGLGIEVYADRPRETWPRGDGELVSDSLPLDMDSLLAAGGDTPYAGMPAGTVVGHVHFYVDNLFRAATFYEQGLGFEATVTSFLGARFVSAGGYHHHVGLNTWAAGAPLAEPDDARLLEWQLVVPAEVRAGIAERLGAAGFAPETLPDGSLQVVDPWRTAVRLVAG